MHTHAHPPIYSYVFDGKPPDMKSRELLKRSEKRAEAEKDLAKATEQGGCGLFCVSMVFNISVGDQDQIERFQKRLVSYVPWDRFPKSYRMHVLVLTSALNSSYESLKIKILYAGESNSETC